MYKAIYLARRNPSIPPEGFPERWRQHSALAGATPGISGFFTSVKQCARLLGADFPPGTSAEFDGINLLGLRDLAASSEVWKLPATAEVMQPDELRVFSRLIIECWMTTEEQALCDHGPGSIAVMRFVKRSAGVPKADFHERLMQTHRLIEHDGSSEMVKRCVHNHMVTTPPPGFDYDVITETWFSSADDARRHYAEQDRWQRMIADCAAYCDLSASVTATTYLSFSKGN